MSKVFIEKLKSELWGTKSRKIYYVSLGILIAASFGLSQWAKLLNERAEEIYQVGREFVDAKAPDRSLSELTEAVVRHPENAWNYINRGEEYGRLARYEDAIADFSSAIEIDPYSVRAYYVRGFTNAILQRYDDAIRDYTRAIELDPLEYILLEERAAIYREIGEIVKAEADETRARELAEQIRPED